MSGQFAQPPGSIWRLTSGFDVIIRDDGRALGFPSMRLLALWPDFTGAVQLRVVSDGAE